MSDDWKAKWVLLSPAEQQQLITRMNAAPNPLKRRSVFARLVMFPWWWWRHYRISRRGMGRIESCRWATRWTILLVFPGPGVRE